MIGGLDDDAPDPITPKYTTQWKNPISVDFSKQSGREQIISGMKKNEKTDLDEINQEISGFENIEHCMKVAEERDEGIERGRALNSKQKKTVFSVLMDKQSVGRGERGGERGREGGVVDETGNFSLESKVLILDLEAYDNGTYVTVILSFL